MLQEESGYLIAQRYSNWQKKKVRTIIVNSRAKNAAQKTIAGAISLAKAYDRIELIGGEYYETISIQIPLELVAAEGEQPQIVSRASTITLAANGVDVYLERLTLISKSSSKLDAAVVTIAGSAILYRCQCSSLLVGGNSVAHVDECSIKDSASGYGLTVLENGGGLLKKTSIRSHSRCCVEIDTRGEFVLTNSTIENNKGGDAVLISGLGSSAYRDGNATYPASSHVEISHCQISVGRSVAGGDTLNVAGDACCIVLTQSAAPTILSNELHEGEIGILIEGPGTAQIKGNIVRCQRRCGILALVEEGFGYEYGNQALRITGDNVLDRCRIGIDVQCAANRLAHVQSSSNGADKLLCEDLPSSRRAYAWSSIQNSSGENSAAVAPAPLKDLPMPPSLVWIEGQWHLLETVKKELQSLVTKLLLSYSTCLQPSFGLVAGAGLSVVDRMTASVSPFTDVLNSMLGTQLAPRKDSAPPTTEILKLRGSRGVDIVNTKFSNCDMCAIRFGRQGYGLVEDCLFEDCGTYAIVVDCAAHPLITGCRFLRGRGASILVNNFANPFILGNEIASGRKDGIELTQMSRGLIVGNIISTHAGIGVRVDGYSQSVICANSISQNRGGGVLVDNNSRPTILLNYFSSNLQAQIRCTGASDAFICNNQILSTADVGILIDDCSRCTIEANTVDSNKIGIVVELDADPYVVRNDIRHNVRSGVLCRNNALGVFVLNRITHNNDANVMVTEGAAAVFRRNWVESSAQGGIVVASEGCGYFEQNSISDNSVANVIVADMHTQPVFTGNKIFQSNSGCGLLCVNHAGGIFTENQIYENKQCGIYVIDSANPSIRKNTISREAIGVMISDNGKGVLTENIITNCYGSAVLSQRFANPSFSKNTMTSSKLSGLHISPDSLGTFEGNIITKNDIGIHLGSAMESAPIDVSCVHIQPATEIVRGGFRSEPTSATLKSSKGSNLGNSVFSPTSERSILQTLATSSEFRRNSTVRTAMSIVKNNQVHHNENGGIWLDTAANATVEMNDIFENNEYGVRGDCTYRGPVEKQVAKNGGDGPLSMRLPSLLIPSQTSSLALLKSNTIHHHREANVFLDHFNGEENPTELTGNKIYAATKGIAIANSSILQVIDNNEIYDCLDGVCVASNGCGSLTQNHVHHCKYSGVYVTDNGNPNFIGKNCIESCLLCGIFVDAGGRGRYTQCTIKHCMYGVIAFCGQTSPFHVSANEIVKANIASSSPMFVENIIEENELHGILLLSVVSGHFLRSPWKLTDPNVKAAANAAAPSKAEGEEEDHDVPVLYRGGVLNSQEARGDAFCPTFEKNIIRRNRVMGVYQDRFDHWDLRAIYGSHAQSVPPSPGGGKNAYGGYGVLLGTSQVLPSDEHIRQRRQKQVSFVENTITECSVGFGAGFGSHPFLLRNRIVKNVFIGILLRNGSAVTAFGNEIAENGLVGLYAASGAKGYLTAGQIVANNGLCRRPESPSSARNFKNYAFSKSFMPLQAPGTVPMSPPAMWDEKNPSNEYRKTFRAYEQLVLLTGVYWHVMHESLRYMAQLAAASSAGLTLASGCSPGTTTRSNTPSTFLRVAGGVGIPNYAYVCTSDGGIGAWIEDGSRVTLHGNHIERHTHMGILFSQGLLEHHKMLHPAFAVSVEEEKGTAYFSIADTRRNPPILACTEDGALFTSHSLCVTGTHAFAQAANAVFESLDSSIVSLSLQSIVLARSDGKENRLEALHFTSIAQNVIAKNEDGICVEVSHYLKAAPITKKPPTSAAGNRTHSQSNLQSSSQRPPSSTSVSRNGLSNMPDFLSDIATDSLPSGDMESWELTDEDTNIMEAIYASLDYTVVVEENQISHNKRHGIHTVQVSSLLCKDFVPSRQSLNEMIDKHYETVRSRLLTSKQVVNLEVELPFGMTVLPRKVGHALIQKNEFFGNEDLQALMSSRFIVVTSDGDSTLLQFDTVDVSRTSSFASQMLIGVPVVAALLQLPPPGVLMWEGNSIRDSRRGICICGYYGPHSARLVNNSFSNISTEALRIEGHLACGTVGKGNVFERNHVGISVAIEYLVNLQTTPYPPRKLRTRIFQNVFKMSKDSSILFDCAGVDAPLLYRNEFGSQVQGTAALVILGDSLRSTGIIHGNNFADSYVPVIISGRRASSGVEGTLSPVRTFFVGNRFTNNYIGVLVCNGAFPQFERNVFDYNVRAGLEVIGNSTRPVVHFCVFRNHVRRPQSPVRASGASDSMGQRRTAAGSPALPSLKMGESAPLEYPVNGILSLPQRNFSIQLPPENHGVLSASNPICLPAGLLIGPFAEAEVQYCAFVDNDIGIDAVRNQVSPSVAVSGVTAAFKYCLFRDNTACGVLVRGSGADDGGKGTKAAENKLASGTAPLAERSGSVDGAKLLSSVTTIFEECVFSENSDTDGCGDVISMDGGFAAFRKNIFCGTVVGKQNGIAAFFENAFVATGVMNESGAAVALPGVLVQDGGCIHVEKNVILRRRWGCKIMPGAKGMITGNQIVFCTMGFFLGPFNRTVVSQNRVLRSADCGVMAYGGNLIDNEIREAPTGIIVQHSSLYNGINAIPLSQRDDVELICARNTISTCTADGILVVTAGLYDSNYVSHCQTGFNIVSPIAGGPAGKVPVVKRNFVYDNVIGVTFEPDSEANVRENDIFDNETMGVTVAVTAAGTLQNNRISFPLDIGAVEIPTDTRVKSMGNVIRNQFSPAFQRGTRAGRLKEYSTQCEALGAEVDKIESDLANRSREMDALLAKVQHLQQELSDFHKKSISDGAAVLTGSAGRALRALLPTALKESAVSQVAKDASELTPKLRPPISPASRHGQNGARRTMVPPPAKRNGSGGRTKTSSLAAAARNNARPATSQTQAESSPQKVFIHVFSKPNAMNEASAIGQSLATILARPPLSRWNMNTIITTSTQQLLQQLDGDIAPFLSILVVERGLPDISTSDHQALRKLHTVTVAARLGRGRGVNAPLSSYSYVLMPSKYSFDEETPMQDESGMTLKDYAAAHQLFTYRTSVEEVLNKLHQQMAEDVTSNPKKGGRRGGGGISNSSSPRGSESLNNSVRKGSDSVATDNSGRADSSQSSPTLGRQWAAVGRGKRGSQLTTEYVGALFSQITPEALGLEPPKPVKAAKRTRTPVNTGPSLVSGGEPKKVSEARRLSLGAHRQKSPTVAKRTNSGHTMKRRTSKGGNSQRRLSQSNTPA